MKTRNAAPKIEAMGFGRATTMGCWVAVVSLSVACGGEGSADPGPGRSGALASVLVAQAASEAAPAPATHVSLSRDVEPILMSRCSGEFCHGLSMTTASRSYAFLVNQPSLECDDMRPLVTPGDPSRSYLVDKMLDHDLCSGHSMPRGLSNGLSQREILAVSEWIRQGARND